MSDSSGVPGSLGIGLPIMKQGAHIWYLPVCTEDILMPPTCNIVIIIITIIVIITIVVSIVIIIIIIIIGIIFTIITIIVIVIIIL